MVYKVKQNIFFLNIQKSEKRPLPFWRSPVCSLSLSLSRGLSSSAGFIDPGYAPLMTRHASHSVTFHSKKFFQWSLLVPVYFKQQKQKTVYSIFRLNFLVMLIIELENNLMKNQFAVIRSNFFLCVKGTMYPESY